MNSLSSNQRGFSFIEVLLGVAIILVSSGSYGMFKEATDLATHQTPYLEAVALGQEKIADLTQVGALVDGSTEMTTKSANATFLIKTKVSAVTNQTKKSVEVRVFWTTQANTQARMSDGVRLTSII